MKAYEFGRIPPHLYLGEIEATPDPFEPGVWRVPAFSVLAAPPEALPGHVIARVGFEDGGWQQIEDHRGKIGYTAAGAPVEVTAVGALIDPIATLAPPPGVHYNWVNGAWVADIDAMRASKLREIDIARDAALVGGFEVAGVRYDSDRQSIQRISGAVTLALINPSFETDWIAFDNSIVTLDAAGLIALGVAAGEHEATQIFKARSLKDSVISAETPEAIASVVW